MVEIAVLMGNEQWYYLDEEIKPQKGGYEVESHLAAIGRIAVIGRCCLWLFCSLARELGLVFPFILRSGFGHDRVSPFTPHGSQDIQSLSYNRVSPQFAAERMVVRKP